MEKQKRLSLTLNKETLAKITTGDQPLVAGGAFSFPHGCTRGCVPLYTHSPLAACRK